MREICPRKLPTADPIIKHSTMICGDGWNYTVALRKSGKFDLYWNYTRKDSPEDSNFPICLYL